MTLRQWAVRGVQQLPRLLVLGHEAVVGDVSGLHALVIFPPPGPP
ncbi:hypothetical protein [Streptomyces sp. NPDC058657]